MKQGELCARCNGVDPFGRVGERDGSASMRDKGEGGTGGRIRELVVGDTVSAGVVLASGVPEDVF